MPLQPGTRLGNYEITSKLGSGGMVEKLDGILGAAPTEPSNSEP